MSMDNVQNNKLNYFIDYNQEGVKQEEELIGDSLFDCGELGLFKAIEAKAETIEFVSDDIKLFDLYDYKNALESGFLIEPEIDYEKSTIKLGFDTFEFEGELSCVDGVYTSEESWFSLKKDEKSGFWSVVWEYSDESTIKQDIYMPDGTVVSTTSVDGDEVAKWRVYYNLETKNREKEEYVEILDDDKYSAINILYDENGERKRFRNVILEGFGDYYAEEINTKDDRMVSETSFQSYFTDDGRSYYRVDNYYDEDKKLREKHLKQKDDYSTGESEIKYDELGQAIYQEDLVQYSDGVVTKFLLERNEERFRTIETMDMPDGKYKEEVYEVINNPQTGKAETLIETTKRRYSEMYEENIETISDFVDGKYCIGTTETKTIKNDGESDKIEITTKTDGNYKVLDTKANVEVDEDISYFSQGNTGDCWLLSSLDAFNYSEKGQKIIQDAITENEDGSYSVVLNGLSEEDRNITITKQELVDAYTNGKYSKGDNTVLVFELAFEKALEIISKNPDEYNQEVFNIVKNKVKSESTKSLLDGGNLILASSILLGETKTEAIDVSQPYFLYENYMKDLDLENGVAILIFRPDENFSEIEETFPKIKDIDGNDVSLALNHAWSIKEINDGIITIVNPWNTETKQYEIDLGELMKYIESFEYAGFEKIKKQLMQNLNKC